MSSTRLSVFVVWALLCLFSNLVHATMPQTPQPTGKPADQARLVADYGKLPLSFEANQGQTAEEVKFIARGPDYSLFLKPDEAVLTMTQSKKRGASGKVDELSRYSGRECRNPDCKDASKPCRPWSLGSGAQFVRQPALFEELRRMTQQNRDAIT